MTRYQTAGSVKKLEKKQSFIGKLIFFLLQHTFFLVKQHMYCKLHNQ